LFYEKYKKSYFFSLSLLMGLIVSSVGSLSRQIVMCMSICSNLRKLKLDL
jgi:hypothetical protein